MNCCAIKRKNRKIPLNKRRDIRGREVSLYDLKIVADGNNNEINNKNFCAGGLEYWRIRSELE